MSPVPDRSLDATYRRRLGEGALTFQRCADGHAVFPPRPLCPTCGARELSWVESRGDATIYSATTIAPREAAPYAVVILDVDEGFRMMSRLDDDDVAAASIGDRVRLAIRSLREDGDPLPLADLVTEPTGAMA